MDENPRPPNRRWLRFSLRTLLLLTALSAAVFWWITWPLRTISEFNSLVAHEQFDEACEMVVAPVGCRVSIDQDSYNGGHCLYLEQAGKDSIAVVASAVYPLPLRAKSPTAAELLLGTRKTDLLFEVDAVRGRIIATPYPRFGL